MGCFTLQQVYAIPVGFVASGAIAGGPYKQLDALPLDWIPHILSLLTMEREGMDVKTGKVSQWSDGVAV